MRPSPAPGELAHATPLRAAAVTPRLLLNADDLGASPAVNDAAFELMARGLIRSATIIGNAPFAREASARARLFQSCSFGVHLNVTEFAPLSRSRALRRILDEEGAFIGSDGGRLRRRGVSLLGAVYEEWCAQIAFVIEHVGRVSHLDSHHMVHNWPPLFPVFKAVQRRFHIRKARLAPNLELDLGGPPTASSTKKRLYNFALRGLYRTRTTDVFVSLDEFRDHRVSLAARCASIEVMLHPGAVDSHDASVLADLADADPGFRRSIISYDEL